MKKKYLTEKNTAKLLDVSPVTIQRWRQQGKIPFKIIKDKIYFNKKEIMDWAKEHDFSLQAAEQDNTKNKDNFYLYKAIKNGGIYYNIQGNDVYSILENAIKKLDFIKPDDSAMLLDELLKREELASTGIGKGVAIPHPRTRLDLNLKEAHVPVFFPENPVEYNALDGQKVFALFMLFTTTTKEHLKLLSKISFVLGNSDLITILQNKNKNDDFIEKIRAIENASAKI